MSRFYRTGRRTCRGEAPDLKDVFSGWRQVSGSIAARNSLYGLEVQKNQPPWLVWHHMARSLAVPALIVQVPEYRLR